MIVGGVIAALVAGATAASISMLLKSRTTSANRQQAFARAEAAAARIAGDAATVVRDGDLTMARVRLLDAGGDARPHDDLLLSARSMHPMRGFEEGAEGGEYEVQYRVEASPGYTGTESLWRRVDHAFDDNQEGGGIASAIVPRVDSLSVEAYDGESWYPTWDSDSDGYPHALRVVVRASSDDGEFTATTRRVVAIDRPPLPPVEEEEEPSNERDPSTTPTNTNTPTTGAGTGAPRGGTRIVTPPANGGNAAPPRGGNRGGGGNGRGGGGGGSGGDAAPPRRGDGGNTPNRGGGGNRTGGNRGGNATPPPAGTTPRGGG